MMMSNGFGNTASLSATAAALAFSSATLAGALPSHGYFMSGQGSIAKANIWRKDHRLVTKIAISNL
jgi:hypothetical protein